MADYLEKTGSTKEWRRGYRIVIENPLGQIPSVTYVMEDVSQDANGKTTHKIAGSMEYEFKDPGEMITMIDQETNEKTQEQYPVGLAAWILYSLFWKLTELPKAQKIDFPFLKELGKTAAPPIATEEKPAPEPVPPPKTASGPII